MPLAPDPNGPILMLGVGHAFLVFWPWCLGLLSSLLLLSGLDDFVPVLICAWYRFRGQPADHSACPPAKDERPIAIFVPCWKESEVIGRMVRHNLAAIRYRNFEFFLGVYPNDAATIAAASELAANFRNVHAALCPHAGPTSKADCLNWIYKGMEIWEEQKGIRFDTIVLHDAEDLIHPDALAVINTARASHAMVQIPVLPLATRFHQVTHAVYCDEFAEFQTIDMPARQFSRSFIPSNGVGTGFSREILELLAGEREKLIFDPASLTEDYEIGIYIHRAGRAQFFAELKAGERGFIATREYFPGKVPSAIRQRTRWITGIVFQSWERDGWRGSWMTRYWFWRDRKGLLANPLSLLTNLLFLAGLADWAVSALKHRPWAFAVSNPAVVVLCWSTLLVQCFRLALRTLCVARIFGVTFALGVPMRLLHCNFINCCASFGAMWRYAHARWRRHPLVWLKTEHAYPARDALGIHRRDLAEILVASGSISEEALGLAQAQKPADVDLTDFLLANGLVSDNELCQALGLHSGVTSVHIDAATINSRVLRSLPAHVQRRFQIVPFRVQAGRLFVAGTRAPSVAALEELRSFAALPIEFQLVTKENYEKLRGLSGSSMVSGFASAAD